MESDPLINYQQKQVKPSLEERGGETEHSSGFRARSPFVLVLLSVLGFAAFFCFSETGKESVVTYQAVPVLLPVLGATNYVDSSADDACVSQFEKATSPLSNAKCVGAKVTETGWCPVYKQPQDAHCYCYDNNDDQKYFKVEYDGIQTRYTSDGVLQYGYKCACERNGSQCKKGKAQVQMTCVPDPSPTPICPAPNTLYSGSLVSSSYWLKVYSFANDSNSTVSKSITYQQGLQQASGLTEERTISETGSVQTSSNVEVGGKIKLIDVKASLSIATDNSNTKTESQVNFDESTIYSTQTYRHNWEIEGGYVCNLYQLVVEIYGQTFMFNEFHLWTQKIGTSPPDTTEWGGVEEGGNSTVSFDYTAPDDESSDED